MTDYPSAYLTADIVVMRVGELDRGYGLERQVLLIERAAEPFKGQLALPGGFVSAYNDERGEVPETAARRELKEETGLVVGMLGFVGVFANPGRDPRGRVVSFAYRTEVDPSARAVAGDDAVSLSWHSIYEAIYLPLAFDHNEILRQSLTPWFRMRSV